MDETRARFWILSELGETTVIQSLHFPPALCCGEP
jgi:hypothetical protein